MNLQPILLSPSIRFWCDRCGTPFDSRKSRRLGLIIPSTTMQCKRAMMNLLQKIMSQGMVLAIILTCTGQLMLRTTPVLYQQSILVGLDCVKYDNRKFAKLDHENWLALAATSEISLSNQLPRTEQYTLTEIFETLWSKTFYASS